ncbi:MAG TPA: MerR family DNA-binding transcriptional regulator, partial [Pseudonocardia sp.]|nr:MerR family DNA-binding transcriptional regulator [Pseudonocardia sp.]
MITLRPVDLAREAGISAQQVRNYEAAGILPPAPRTASGYRRYAMEHVDALRTYRALVPGFGTG